MKNFELGSKGEEVRKIQAALKSAGFYKGPVDGDFGGGTEASVRAFQAAKGLTADGKVGPMTWKALVGNDLPAPEIIVKPMAYRCLAMTGGFETSTPPPDCFAGLTGDFDKMGISFGALQWNIGSGSLQPLLLEMQAKNPDLLKSVFGSNYETLLAVLKEKIPAQLSWARSIQNSRFVLAEPWRGQFKALGRSTEFQAIEVAFAGKVFEKAVAMIKEYGLKSERAVALMYDIVTQNGSISAIVKQQILSDFSRSGLDEVQRMRIVAQRRAIAAKKEFIQDVLERKLMIANGSGTVHGSHYDLAQDYGITLGNFVG